MNKGIYQILVNEQLTASVWRMKLQGDSSAISAPGQFVNLALPGLYLRRPISICDYDDSSITLVYKVVGEGTGLMSTLGAGDKLDLLVGLGNGFDISSNFEKPLLVGGGVGVPPLYNLAKKLIAAGKRPNIILGFNTADEIFYKDEFEALGAKVIITTADGSAGLKGFVTDALEGLDFDRFFSCGPIPMLKALSQRTDKPGQVSLEERMGCGFGACMGCTHEMLGGAKRICKDGPVFEKEEVIW